MGPKTVNSASSATESAANAAVETTTRRGRPAVANSATAEPDDPDERDREHGLPGDLRADEQQRDAARRARRSPPRSGSPRSSGAAGSPAARADRVPHGERRAAPTELSTPIGAATSSFSAPHAQSTLTRATAMRERAERRCHRDERRARRSTAARMPRPSGPTPAPSTHAPIHAMSWSRERTSQAPESDDIRRSSAPRRPRRPLPNARARARLMSVMIVPMIARPLTAWSPRMTARSDGRVVLVAAADEAADDEEQVLHGDQQDRKGGQPDGAGAGLRQRGEQHGEQRERSAAPPSR